MKQIFLMLMALLIPSGIASAQGTLLLDDILNSVEKNYPPLLATLAEREIADAEALQALGKFDFQIGAQYDTARLGYYRNQSTNLGIEQPFRTMGASAYAGYRVSEGSFAPYAGALDTRSLGEWRTGIKLPLIRNREIDDKRAGLQRAELGLRIADLTIDQQRLVIRQLAARRYWDWVAAGQRQRIAQDILRVAQERDQALREAARLGSIPAIEVTENQRQILQRQSQVVEAERGIQQAAIELSLFYRDSRGRPQLPDADELPDTLPPTSNLTDQQFNEDMESALRKRPEIARFTAQKQQTEVDIRLAKNDRLPAVDLGMGFTSQNGAGSSGYSPHEVKASVRFELPYQRRAATGKLRSAEAKYRQYDQREQFARDQVQAEVRDAASAVRAAHNRTLLATEEKKVAEELADAERERFRLGDSTLFTVNLREQAAVDAELRQLQAANDYLRALTVYEQVTARLLN
jgi:outer membrane protein TolC